MKQIIYITALLFAFFNASANSHTQLSSLKKLEKDRIVKVTVKKQDTLLVKKEDIEITKKRILKADSLADAGFEKYKNKDFNGAISDFENSIVYHPNSPIVYKNLGLSFYQINEFNKAIEALNKAQKLDRANEKIYFTLKGSIEYKRNNLDEAIRNYNYALKIDSLFADAHYLKGVTLLTKNNTTDACKSIQKAIDLGNVPANTLKKDHCK